MTKEALRKYYSEKRISLSASERNKFDDLILILFQQLEIAPHVQSVLSYWPLPERGEINSFLFTDFLEFRIPSLQLAYPVCDFTDHSMEAILVEEGSTFRRNRYGIAEPVDGRYISPTEIDLVLVPLLAFDTKGYRLGYGKGFYDRFLERCRKDVIRIGFSYFDAEPAIPGVDQFDVPLNYCLTPDAIYEF